MAKRSCKMILICRSQSVRSKVFEVPASEAFCFAWLIHDVLLLADEDGLEGLGNRLLARLKAALLDLLLYRRPDVLRKPHVRFPLAPFPAGRAKFLDAFVSR